MVEQRGTPHDDWRWRSGFFLIYFFGPISPDFLLFFPTDNTGKAEIAGTETGRHLDRSLTLADGAYCPRRPCGPVASPPREQGGHAVPTVPGPPEPLGRGEHVARTVLIALATLRGQLSNAGRHATPKRHCRPAGAVTTPSWASPPGLGGQGRLALPDPDNLVAKEASLFGSPAVGSLAAN